jgi:hypothetical protein
VLNVGEQLRLSRPVFAHYLRTNPRTLENRKQGRAKPNAQATLLIRMVGAVSGHGAALGGDLKPLCHGFAIKRKKENYFAFAAEAIYRI